jgi:hypothetical protein
MSLIFFLPKNRFFLDIELKNVNKKQKLFSTIIWVVQRQKKRKTCFSRDTEYSHLNRPFTQAER